MRFVVAMREATSSEHPVLLRVWPEVGHGSLNPRVGAELQAEWLSFVMQQLVCRWYRVSRIWRLPSKRL